MALAGLAAAFALPLHRLALFALGSDLYSYILLIPVISLGLVLLRRQSLPGPSQPNRRLGILLVAGGGAAVLAGSELSRRGGADGNAQDFLTLVALSFALCFAGVCCWFLGRQTIRAIAFPLAFLALIAPLPVFLAAAIETFLQHASAAAAGFFFQLSGMPVFQRNDLDFQLPGMRIEVARQCSGLHATLALFITSLPAGYLGLRSPWKRAALSLAAIPIGIVRNGFRVFVIGQLCVRIGPEMIDSYIHRTGGWIFFLLFLTPFLALLLLLARSERSAGATGEFLEV